jgi:hypothetical protein
VVISYRLHPKDLPTNPQKIWRGKVIYQDKEGGVLMVESLEPGYIGMKELVKRAQVIDIS